MSNETSLIAQIGKTVGLWGDLKFYLHTDFPEQFQIGKSYKTTRGNLTIADINFKRGIIRFVGYESVDSAKPLTNVKIFATIEETKANCQLNEKEYFWFDLIGCVVKEETILGEVKEIQRIGDTDYFMVQTAENLVQSGQAKAFLIPYIPHYIKEVDLENKVILTQDALLILEAS